MTSIINNFVNKGIYTLISDFTNPIKKLAVWHTESKRQAERQHPCQKDCCCCSRFHFLVCGLDEIMMLVTDGSATRCEDSSSTDTEDYLDLADLNDFQECSSTLIWQDDKVKTIEKLIGNGCDATLLRDACISRGGLMNGKYFYYLYCFI